MPNTPVQGLPYPALSDPANGPVAFQNLATALEDYKTIVRCTSSTRPAHVEGRVIYETDTDRIQVSDGTAWRSIQPLKRPDGWFTWDSFSMPNLYQTATYRKIRRDGDTVYGRASVDVISGGSIGPILIDFPIVDGVQWYPAADARFNEDQLWGQAQFLRNGVAWYSGVIKPIIYASVKRMGLYNRDGAGSAWSVNTPATFQPGDRVGIDFMYEAAPLT